VDEIKLILTQQDVGIIFQALGELPLKVSGAVFSKIQTQILEQQNVKTP